MKKIQRDRLFIQVRYRDLLEKFWLIFLFKVNCEVYINPTEVNSYDAAKITRLAALLDKRGALRRVHAPVYDPNKKGFKEYKEIYHKTSRFSKHLGSDTIIMHPEGYWPEENLYIWEEIASSAGKDSIKVLLENHQERSEVPIVKILTTVNSEYLKACFDVGHFYVFGEKDLASILSRYPAGSIKEIHLSDNLGNEDSHLPLGSGKINYLNFFEAVDKISLEPYYTIEAKDMPGAVKGIRYLKKIGLF